MQIATCGAPIACVGSDYIARSLLCSGIWGFAKEFRFTRRCKGPEDREQPLAPAEFLDLVS